MNVTASLPVWFHVSAPKNFRSASLRNETAIIPDATCEVNPACLASSSSVCRLTSLRGAMSFSITTADTDSKMLIFSWFSRLTTGGISRPGSIPLLAVAILLPLPQDQPGLGAHDLPIILVGGVGLHHNILALAADVLVGEVPTT